MGRAEGRQGGSSNPYRVLSLWWSNHHKFHREWNNAVNSFIMRSTIPWQRFVPRDNTTFAYNLADVNGTLHDVVEKLPHVATHDAPHLVLGRPNHGMVVVPRLPDLAKMVDQTRKHL